MSITKQVAKHLREVHFGGNWTTTNLKDILKDVTWYDATKKVHDFNTIATLVYHTGYYVEALFKVLNEEPLSTKDELSFSHPPIQSENDWRDLLDITWRNAERTAVLIETLPDNKLWENFTDVKYGTYYRNFHGIIEHLHYHLGQIVLLKKLVLQTVKSY